MKRLNSAISLRVILFILFIIPSVLSQIVDVFNPILYEDPKSQFSNDGRSSYFGYTLLLYSRNGTHRLVVGAPRSNSSSLGNVHEPGEIYSCGIKKICKPIVLDDKETIPLEDHKEMKEKSWLGGSMALHPTKDRLSVCAPRRYIDIKDDRIMEGACYVTTLNEDKSGKKVIPLHPLYVSDQKFISYKYVKPKEYVVYDHGLAQLGMSSYFSSVQNSQEESPLVLGAPGVLNSIGTTVRLSSSHQNQKSEMDINPKEFDNILVPKLYTNKDFNDGDYFGYSIISGYFYGKKKGLWHVSAAPRGQKYVGKVIVYQFPTKSHFRPMINRVLTGDKIGAYFGASLAAADFNGDGFDDLLIGAPFGVEPKVHIYLGNERGPSAPTESSTKYLKMTKWGRLSQFGISLATTDFNHDGFADVVVGAPEAENDGAIAIFMGKSTGLEENPTQVIFSKDRFTQKVRGFGISLAPPQDIDDNSYTDVAVGSYKSGHAVIFRAIPEACLEASLKLLESTSEDVFVLEACLLYSWKNNMNASSEIKTMRTLVIDRAYGRATLTGSPSLKDKTTYKHPKTLTVDKPSCEKLELKLSQKTEYFIPMDVTINVAKIETKKQVSVIQVNGNGITGTDNFDKWDPVISASDNATQTLSFPLTKCSNNCSTDLKISAYLPQYPQNKRFIVGSANVIHLFVAVENLFESAYAAKVIITLPQDVSLARSPSFCRTSGANVICDVDNPFTKGKSKNFTLEVDMKGLSETIYQPETKEISINATSDSIDQDPSNNVEKVQLHLGIDSKIVLAGKTEKDAYSFNETNGKTSNEYVEFDHTYEVQKSGISDVHEVLLTVKTPYMYYKNNKEIEFLKLYRPSTYHNGQEFGCETADYNYALKEIGTNEQIDDSIQSPNLNPAAQMKKRSIENSFSRGFLTQRFKRSKENESVSFKIKELSLNDLPINRTVILSCDMPEVRCLVINCHVGPLRHDHPVAKLVISMYLNISTLKENVLGIKDIIAFTSQGEATILKIDDNIVTAQVKSIFVSSPSQLEVELWIIILSIILGLLLVLFVTIILFKCGFFRRQTKEELEKMKADAASKNAEKKELVDDPLNKDDDFGLDQDSLPCEDLVGRT